MLTEVLETFNSKRISNGSVGSLQSEERYPSLQPNSRQNGRWGLVKVSHVTPWKKLAGKIKRKIQSKRYLNFEEVNILTAKFAIEEEEWKKLWKPIIWETNGLIIKICRCFDQLKPVSSAKEMGSGNQSHSQTADKESWKWNVVHQKLYPVEGFDQMDENKGSPTEMVIPLL